MEIRQPLSPHHHFNNLTRSDSINENNVEGIFKRSVSLSNIPDKQTTVKRLRMSSLDQEVTEAGINALAPETSEITRVIDKEELSKIRQFLKQHKKVKDTTHIRGSQVPPEAGGPLKFSLIIKPDGNALVLLKGKSSAKLRAKGQFKTVKAAVDLATGKIVAHCTYDLDAETRRQVGPEIASGNASKEALLRFLYTNKYETKLKHSYRSKTELFKHLETYTEPQLTEIILKTTKQDLRQEVNKEFQLLNADFFCEYQSKPTSSEKISQRKAEGKPLREGVHGIIGFSMPIAESSLENPETEKRILEAPLRLVNCIQDMATGIADLHDQGIVHMDIKPDNLLIGKDGKAYWSDFGRSSHVSENKLIVGALYITDPILFRMKHSANSGKPDLKKGDVYSLGLTFFRLLTHKHTEYTKEINNLADTTTKSH